MASASCIVCRRPLRDPISVQAGMGRVCRGRIRAEKEAREAERIPPEFTIEDVTLEDMPRWPLADKVYLGVRHRGEAHVLVEREGARYPLRHIVYHSPTGFEWGYGGSGPADLARSILADVAEIKVADALYQTFKREVIAALPADGFRFSEAAVRLWLREKLIALAGEAAAKRGGGPRETAQVDAP